VKGGRYLEVKLQGKEWVYLNLTPGNKTKPPRREVN